MMQTHVFRFTIRTLCFLSAVLVFGFVRGLAYSADRVVLVIIDGLRYSEGLGDPSHAQVPHMASLAEQGSLIAIPRMMDSPIPVVPFLLSGVVPGLILTPLATPHVMVAQTIRQNSPPCLNTIENNLTGRLKIVFTR